MRLISIAAAAALLLLVTGCGNGHPRTSAAPIRPASHSTIGPVDLIWAPVPKSGSPSITISGRYPQISHPGGPSGPALVNGALRSMVVDDIATQQTSFGGASGSTSVTYGGGDFFVNDAVVSVLEQVRMVSDTGGAGEQQYWVAGTWLLPTGTQLKMDDLFTNPGTVWPALGKLAHQALRTGPNACTASSVDDSLSVVDWTDPKLYSNFVVAKDGLHLGFNQYAVAEGACGSSTAVVPWKALRSRLSAVGRDVVADVQT